MSASDWIVSSSGIKYRFRGDGDVGILLGGSEYVKPLDVWLEILNSLQRDKDFPFMPGDAVNIKTAEGGWGHVIVADKSRDQYLVDVYPGANSDYCYVRVGNRFYAANWYKSAHLEHRK